MRTKLSIVVLVLCCMLSGTLMAQNKIGHVNTADVLDMMPQKAKMEADIVSYQKKLEKNYNLMREEYQTKLTSFEKEQSDMPPTVKESRTNELLELQRRIGQFEVDAQNDLMKYQNDLIEPIRVQIVEAIEQVASENGFTYIFDTAAGNLLVKPDSDDIISLLRPKLGL